MRRFWILAFGAVIGAGIAYLLDPDRGRSRRARLADQATARGRGAAKTAQQAFEYQKGVMKGAAHDLAQRFQPETAYDDETLIQKVRSEALGYWDGPDSVEIDITNGVVTVSGSVHDTAEHDRLLALIEDVDGITMIEDRVDLSAG
jgi:osmotically-inducible protein OsmY